MKYFKNISLIFTAIIFQFANAQQIVFTAKNSLNEDVFWRIDLSNPNSYFNITEALNSNALYSGINKGPISTSHNGNYYIFQSERFDTNIDGYEAITICKSDFSSFEVPRDINGNVYHSEGIMQISNDGNTILFCKGDGTHSRDVYKITKNGNSWSIPIELTTNSNLDYNISPYLSYDETKLLFESSSDPYSIESIKEININGTNLLTKVATSNISSSSQIKSPCYDFEGNIFFEGETDAERIYKLSKSGGSPSVVKSSFTNDNSPITLPNGKIASLYLPNSTHQIKVMDTNGSNDQMFTSTNSDFIEVSDIGMSAGEMGLAGIKNESLLKDGLTIIHNKDQTITISSLSNGDYYFSNSLGQELSSFSLSNSSMYTTPILTNGVYFIRSKDIKQSIIHKVLIQN
jgi:hypothetical protein